ncbi:MAG TPA: DUF192 domain-containing protein [Clostridia bacterium]|nr:DUF192 domain-containing protein [Clostridia bacterium]
MATQGGIIRVYNFTRGSYLGEQVEVADTSLKRMIGLLGRRSLEPGSGLLIFPSQAIHTVGMSFPIDVVFLDRSNHVISLRENVRPFRLTSVVWRAVGVVELPSGTIRETRTAVGDQLNLEF